MGWLVAAVSLPVTPPVLPFTATVRLYDALRGSDTEVGADEWPSVERERSAGTAAGRRESDTFSLLRWILV